MRVSEIMSSDPVTVSPRQTLAEAAALMAQIDAGFLPVGENDKLVGMLTDRDIAIRGIGAGRGPDAMVGEAMTQDVCYCFEDDDVTTVAQNMGDQQIRRIPVVNREKRLVGVLSLGDLAGRGDALAAGEALAEVAQPGDRHN